MLENLVQRAILRSMSDGDLIWNVLRHRAQIRSIVDAHGATAIALFGSVARGQARASSDLDFAVEVKPGTTLFDLARMRAELIDLFDVDVDVVALNGLDAGERRSLEADAIRI